MQDLTQAIIKSILGKGVLDAYSVSLTTSIAKVPETKNGPNLPKKYRRMILEVDVKNTFDTIIVYVSYDPVFATNIPVLNLYENCLNQMENSTSEVCIILDPNVSRKWWQVQYCNGLNHT